MAMVFDSTKWNRCVLSGLSTDSPLLYFWDCYKQSWLACNGPKMSMCWVLEIDEINGLSCIGISRLMHELCVLT